jgi:hypothetical protein
VKVAGLALLCERAGATSRACHTSDILIYGNGLNARSDREAVWGRWAWNPTSGCARGGSPVADLAGMTRQASAYGRALALMCHSWQTRFGEDRRKGASDQGGPPPTSPLGGERKNHYEGHPVVFWYRALVILQLERSCSRRGIGVEEAAQR